MYKNKYILLFVFLCFTKVPSLKGLEYKFRLFDFTVAVPISDALLHEHLAILYNELEPREIADEMFQAGHINVSDHDDVTECPKKWKRMKCLLNILKNNKLYTPFGYTLSLKYVEVLDVLQQGRETTSITCK